MSEHAPAGDRDHVLVLGAGFSAAFSNELPIANELGNQAIARTDITGDGPRWSYRPYWSRGGAVTARSPTPPPRFSSDFPFESWLSLLAEDQPYLSETENRKNAGRFAELSEAVARTLDDAQATAFGQDGPAWLYELLSVLHERRATLVTLNYDTVIETGVESHWLVPDDPRPVPPFAPVVALLSGRESRESRVRPTDLLRDQPPAPAGGYTGLSFLVPTMRLFKLHGSIDWWWVPGDPSGASLGREGVYGRFGSPKRMGDEERRQALPGRERFIVPPLATKSPYYRNPLTKQLWQDAYEAVSGAGRISLVGYSLPVTDFVMAGMLQSKLRDEQVHVDVVDLDADAVCERVKALGGPTEPDGRLYVWSGQNAVKDYTATLCDETSGDVVDRVREFLTSINAAMPIFVDWRTSTGTKILKVARATGPNRDGTVTVDTAPLADVHLVDPTPTPDQPTIASLAGMLSGAKRLAATHGGSEGGVVVSMSMTARWLTLTPARLLAR